jgi:hypothetical protein
VAAALGRLQTGCQLAEAMATGFDPRHPARVFSIGEQAAIRLAVNARHLPGPAQQAAATTVPRS